MDFDALHYLHGRPQGTGVLKAFPEDFFVSEDLGFEPDGEGEHLLVRIRKEGCNTQFVADNLARFAKIPQRSVSYAGLKDRHAVTEQWFCLHLPGKESPDLSQFILEGCQVVRSARHLRKLRIGTLKGNTFRLVLRHITDRDDVEQRLQAIATEGAPNYFGAQRFGRGGNNLIQAAKWSRGEIQVRERAKRSFYLSAARSAMFNQITNMRLAQDLQRQVMLGDAMQLTGRGSWFVANAEELESLQQRTDGGELQITAALPGDNDLGTRDLAAQFEQQAIADYADLLALVKRERVESARRAMLVKPQEMSWSWWDDATVEVEFALPAGCFATSIVRELFNQENPNADLAE